MRSQLLLWMIMVLCGAGQLEAQELAPWTERFALQPPLPSEDGLPPAASPEDAAPGLPEFTCTAAAPGRELVRVSLPFAPGVLPAEAEVLVHQGEKETTPDLRVLTLHPGRPQFVRRALVTFPFDFQNTAAVHFTLTLRARHAVQNRPLEPEGDGFAIEWQGWRLHLGRNDTILSAGARMLFHAAIIAPPAADQAAAAVPEGVELGENYLWVRLLVSDPAWPRIIEARLDTLGRLALRAHLQRMTDEGGETAADLGWRIDNTAGLFPVPAQPHDFTAGDPAQCAGTEYALHFPDAHLLRRGTLSASGSDILYMRCFAREQVPHQRAAWRTATVQFGPATAPPLNALLEPALKVTAAPEKKPLELQPWPRIDAAMRYHLDTMAEGYMKGDDFGNVGGMPSAGVYSMNRLNHCPPLFGLAQTYQDPRLRETALLWCSNFYDLTIWWGEDKAEQFGGTRYNNRAAANPKYPQDSNFMWRSNDAVHFCTKGYDSFFHAWEETGDPRMAVALRWQVDYATRMVHTNEGEARNIGDVLDFVQLYRFMRRPEYLENALRLFRELRERVGEDGLFSQSGDPIVKESPFIDNDEEGYKYPFAKPYIIGYALAGLPTLLELAPEEPRLLEVVRAVANFLAESEDPVGGWRYPHPQSSRILVGQGIEHAAQIVRAAEVLEARGEDISGLLDAVERVLQARVLGYARTGAYFAGVEAWERTTGAVAPGASVQPLYPHPKDRDPSRDYTEGAVSAGGNSPEGVVYFPEVLAFYLKHRPAERLFHANDQLTLVLARLPEKQQPEAAPRQPQALNYGLESELPTFLAAQSIQVR